MMPRGYAPIDPVRLAALAAEGKPDSELAAEFAVNIRTIERWRKRLGIASQWKPVRGTSHGVAGYTRGCRCDVCREANRLQAAEWRRSVRARVAELGLPRGVDHGLNAYGNYGCRCDVCKAAGAVANAATKARAKQRAAS